MDTLEEMKKVIRHAWLDGPTAPDGVEIGPGTRFVEDLQIDSLAAIEIVLMAEVTFNLDIPDGDYDHIKTVQEAVAYVDSKLVSDVPGKESL